MSNCKWCGYIWMEDEQRPCDCDTEEAFERRANEKRETELAEKRYDEACLRKTNNKEEQKSFDDTDE